MAKKKNSGKQKQDAVLAQFRRDIRSNINGSAVMQCMRKTPAPIVKKDVVEFSYRQLFSCK